MTRKIIVLVSDLDDAKHGEITALDSAQNAARLVETLLEAGFDTERIRVFNSEEMEMQVTHRPVVALIDGSAEVGAPEGEEAPAEAPARTEKRREAMASAVSAAHAAEPASVPFHKDGVRFSSLFRPA